MRATALLSSFVLIEFVRAFSSSTEPPYGSVTSFAFGHSSAVPELSFNDVFIFPRMPAQMEAREERRGSRLSYPLADREDISPAERLFRVAAAIYRTREDPDDWAGKWAIKYNYADQDKAKIAKWFIDYAFDIRYGGESPLHEINDTNLFDAAYRQIHGLSTREYEPLTTVANPRTIDPAYFKLLSEMRAFKTKA